MRIINKKYLLIILLVGIITGAVIMKPKEKIQLDNVILKQEVNNKTFAMYIKNDDAYEKYEGTKFPEGYDLNLNKSKCVDKDGVEIENVLYTKDNKVGVKSNKSFYCYLYFDLLEEKEFEYTGNYQVFIAPKTGNYEIDLWGASGGDIDSYFGGKGAYTKGIIQLQKSDKLYIYVGGIGNEEQGGYNGGGDLMPGNFYAGRVGGGATDVRLNISETGNWNDFNSLKSRIMVAAGGGGANNRNSDYLYAGNYYGAGNGGSGGALIGIAGESLDESHTNPDTHKSWGWAYGSGGTQNGAGDAVIFGENMAKDDSYLHRTLSSFGYGGMFQSGGGGGYYGGGSSAHGGGGGGSSFISGYKGCIAIEESSTEENIKPKDGCTEGSLDVTCSYHYSNKIFTNTEMLAGNAEMPTHDGKDTMIGNTGNGHAKIKLVSVG